MNDQKAILTADHLYCGYGKAPVLKDICFEAQKGEIISIIGPNGSGKTTLLKTLCGVLKPRQGKIFIQGEEIRHLSRASIARTVARVSQTIDMPPMTVSAYVLMGRLPYFKRYQFFESRADVDKVKETLTLLGIDHLAEKSMDTISGGQQQLAAIARALVQEPDLLLLDEPTSHLDITHQAVILNQIRRLNQQFNLSVIMVLHDLNLASEYAHRLILLNGKEGEVFRNGSPEKVITKECIETVYKTPVIVDRHPRSGKPFILLDG
ncbi:MAG: ABC transporter ATP-binding protein [Desulfobacterium sp.]